MDKLKSIFNKTDNLITGILIIAIVALLLTKGVPFIKNTLLNDINRIYDEYTLITNISTDYVNNSITITVGSTSWFDVTDNTKTYSLDKVYNSKLFIIDNSISTPALIDNVVHIPDTYPR